MQCHKKTGWFSQKQKLFFNVILVKHNSLQVAYCFSFKSFVLFAATVGKNRAKWLYKSVILLELKPGSVVRCAREFTARSSSYFFLRVSSSNFTYLVDLSQGEGCKLLFTRQNWARFLCRKVAFLQSLYKLQK